MEQWDRIMTKRRNGPLSWESLVAETTTPGGISIIPLTNEEQLRDETTLMDHCVIGYGDDCASGQSRIFSIRQQGKTIATGEITPNQKRDQWRVTQVRGFMNNRVSPEIEQLMQEVSEAYTQASNELVNTRQ